MVIVWRAQQYERRRIKVVVTIKEIAEMSGVSRGIVEVIAKCPNQQEYVFVPYYSWGNREIGKMKVWQN